MGWILTSGLGDWQDAVGTVGTGDERWEEDCVVVVVVAAAAVVEEGFFFSNCI
jgi:hypothetical protein